MTPTLELPNIQWAVIGEYDLHCDGNWKPFERLWKDGFPYTEESARESASFGAAHPAIDVRNVRAAFRILPAWTDAPEVAA